MKKVFYLLAAFLTVSVTTLKAQDTCTVCKPYKWEVGIPLGLTQYYGDLHCSKPYRSSGANWHIGAFVRRHINDYFALRGNLLVGRFAADDFDQPNGYWDYRGLKVKSPLTELALLGEYYPLKERKYTCDGALRKTLTPYLFGGIGAAFTKPTITQQSGTLFPADLTNGIKTGRQTSLVLPLGLGVKYNATDRFTVGLESGYRFAFSDYLEGISQQPYSKKNDGYLITSVLGSYRFGDKDNDKDGVVDRCDICPSEKGLKKFQGCPDTDGDGIPDKDDACPTQAGPASLKGCPDTDGDGIADKDDACPTQAGPASLKGCPDRDKDGVADKDDACPDVTGLKALKGCPDTDGDGIADKDDACPTEAGPASCNGCPDTDGDGICDKNDDCPKVAGTVACNGCGDTDGDGLCDSKDACPTVAGLLTNNGCPNSFKGYRTTSGCEISETELGDLNAAAGCIEFYPGTNKLKASSYKCLDRVCAVLQRCPDASLNISAFQDGNSTASNLRAGKLRACAIYAYFLKKKCITKARMYYDGNPDEDPTTSYTNSAGKKVGTRIQFTLK
jgi:OOP family OmpA-OmpF porin